MIVKTVVFCDVPIFKGFKYREKFQLVPFHETELKLMMQYANHFPLFLEFAFDKVYEKLPFESELRSLGISEDKILASRHIPTQERIRDEILQLLTCLTNYHFFSYKAFNSIWGVQFSLEKQSENDLKSRWTVGCYRDVNTNHTQTIEKFTDISFFYNNTVSDYFTYKPTSIFSSEISFPLNLEDCLDKYYSLDDVTSKRVRHCVCMLSDGIELFNRKRSVSLLSIISSIEGMALIDNQKYANNDRLSPTKRFIKYLETYVAGKSTEKFSKFYKRRCNVAHESELCIGDIDIYADIEEQDKDLLFRIEIMQAARMGLYNWLGRL